MTAIRINHEQLSSSARKLRALVNEAEKLSEELTRIGASAPSYRNQFSPRVRSLTNQARSHLKGRSSSLRHQADRLARIASAFSQADRFRWPRFPIWDLEDMPRYVILPIYRFPWERVIRIIRIGRIVLPRMPVLIIGSDDREKDEYRFYPYPFFPIGKIFREIYFDLYSPIENKVTGSDPSSNVEDSAETIGQEENTAKPIADPVKVVPEGGSFSRGFTPGHKAMDIAGEEGLPLIASFVGTVVFSSDINCPQLPLSEIDKYSKDPTVNYGYGNEMIIEYKFDQQSDEVKKYLSEKIGLKSGESVYMLYAHLEHGSLLPAGTDLMPGDKLAEMGNSGISTGPHVHVEIIKGPENSIKASDLHKYNNWYSLVHSTEGVFDPKKLFGDHPC